MSRASAAAAPALAAASRSSRASRISSLSAKAIEGNSSKPFTHAYIGPHISREHFEVKDDFIEAFIENNKDITLLASSPVTKYQIFKYQNHAYGIQFHIEIKDTTVNEWGCVPEYKKALEYSSISSDRHLVIVEGL